MQDTNERDFWKTEDKTQRINKLKKTNDQGKKVMLCFISIVYFSVYLHLFSH